MFMANFSETSEVRRRDVLDRRYYVSLVDRQDDSKKFHFDCGSDLLFFLSFVDWDSYFVIIEDSLVPGDHSSFSFSDLKTIDSHD